jgi:hypothetical protein
VNGDFWGWSGMIEKSKSPILEVGVWATRHFLRLDCTPMFAEVRLKLGQKLTEQISARNPSRCVLRLGYMPARPQRFMQDFHLKAF